MTREEAKKIVMIIKTAYPNWRPDDLSFTVNTWAVMLSDYDYQAAVSALKIYITTDTSGFAPSIGQVIGKIHIKDTYMELNEMEAWALVSRALRNGYYGAEEEYENLPPEVQQAVGSPSNLRHWATTEMDSVENVIQSNFMRSYRTVMQRKREYTRMSKELKKLVGNPTKALEGR